MAGNQQASEPKIKAQRQPKTEAAGPAAAAAEAMLQVEWLTGPLAGTGSVAAVGQAERLGNGQMQHAQRIEFAGRIRRVQGNAHLQRTLSPPEREAAGAPREPHGQAERPLAHHGGLKDLNELTAGRGLFAETLVVQRGLWSSMQQGARMYLGLDDEGAEYARQLMEWRILGYGRPFERGGWGTGWSYFLIGRPEIQRAMATKFESMARTFAAGGPGQGRFTDSVTNVRLNELESMRLTLHGCHRIDISGTYEVSEEEEPEEEVENLRQTMARPAVMRFRQVQTVRFSDVQFIWVDSADLHPGTVTELSTGEEVDDREFTSAGWDYDIRITFAMPSTSTWRVSEGRTAHERGWPPVTGAPAAGFRG